MKSHGRARPAAAVAWLPVLDDTLDITLDATAASESTDRADNTTNIFATLITPTITAPSNTQTEST